MQQWYIWLWRVSVCVKCFMCCHLSLDHIHDTQWCLSLCLQSVTLSSSFTWLPSLPQTMLPSYIHYINSLIGAGCHLALPSSRQQCGDCLAAERKDSQNCCVLCCVQGSHKPGMHRDFSERGKLRKFSRNSVQPQGKLVTNKVALVRHSYICIKQFLTG